MTNQPKKVALKQWEPFVMLLDSGLLIVLGLFLACTVVVKKKYIHVDLPYLESYAEADKEAQMIFSFINITAGIIALVATLMRSRVVVTLTAGFVLLLVIMDLSRCVYSFRDAFGALEFDGVANPVIENIYRFYGLSNEKGKHFTKHIDDYQQVTSCCGFSADARKNIFLDTYWFYEMNRTVEGQSKRLPKSCCIDPDKLRECMTAENLLDAREKYYVFYDDCIEAFARGLRKRRLMNAICSVVTMVLKILFFILAILLGEDLRSDK